MESSDFPISLLQSFQSLSVSPTSLVFDKEFAKRTNTEEFVATVNQYLHLHNGKVENFHIYLCPWEKYLPDIRNWVAFAVAKGVEEFNLDLSMGFDPWNHEFTNGGKSFKLPSNLFECRTLTSLSLSNCDFCPSDFSFCQLQSLSLTNVSITCDDLQRIIINCPFIDSLSFHACLYLESITISSFSLPKLTIVNQFSAYQIQICTPKLESFIYYGEHIFGYSWEMMLESSDSFTDISSLSDAFISSIGMESTEPEHDYIQLLYDLRHVKILTICTSTLLRVGTYDDIKFPILMPNLKELQILMDSMSIEYLTYLYHFFRFCPSPFLEKLFIQLPSNCKDPKEEYQVMKVCLLLEPSEVIFTSIKDVEDPTDVVFHRLKVIKMNKFTGCKSEMRLVKFLLEKANVLESLVLVAPPTPDSDKNMDIEITNSISDTMSNETIDLVSLHRHISMFTVTSPGAKIVLCEYLEDDNSLTPTHTEYFCDF